MSYVELLDYHISNKGLCSDISEVFELIGSGEFGHYMACANPHSLTVAAEDNIFRQALKRADILIPDGTGIIIAAKILGLSGIEKVAGTDFFLGLSREANKRGGVKYFFLGSSEKVLGLIDERIRQDFPAIEVCGTYSPPFKTEFSQEDNSAMISAVNYA